MTLVQLLEELAATEPVVTVPAEDLERLAARFGDRVRRMGKWNVSGDRSLQIPIKIIRDAAAELGNDTVAQAARELEGETFNQMLESSSAASLIGKIVENYERYFRELMTRYQNAQEPAEKDKLRDALVREVFGE